MSHATYRRHLARATTRLIDEAAVQPAVLGPGLRPATDIGLTVTLDAGVPIQGLRSPSHAITQRTVSLHQAVIGLDATDTIPNKDFVLRYDVAGAEPALTVLAHRDPAQDAEGTLFLLAQPPEDPTPAEVTAKEMVFVIDASSSMRGRPLE